MIVVLGVLLDEFCFLSEVSLKLIWSLLGTADDWMTHFELGDKLVRSSGKKSKMGTSQLFRLFRTQKCQIIGTFNFILLLFFLFLMVCKISHSSLALTGKDLISSWQSCWHGRGFFSLIISCTDWKLTVNVRHALLPNNSWHGKKCRFDRGRGSYY